MEENPSNTPPPPLLPPASLLPEDLLAEILSRVPYSSLCRFKCVSKSWLALCSNPAIRRRSPQTLSGFFYRLASSGQHLQYGLHFTNLSGRGRHMVDPSLSFMPACKKIEIIDSSNGLLLCHCVKMSPEHQYGYVVCNPAIEKWILLPYTEAMEGLHTVRLGFDPAASSHFTVFLLVKEFSQDQYCQVTGVEAYSSKTGAWTYRQSEWGDDCIVHITTKSVFFNGIMHFTTTGSSVATVDMELNRWRKIPTPRNTVSSLIGLSQGRLYLLHMDYCNDYDDLSVWVLEDYGSEQWTLKHSVSKSKLFDDCHLRSLTAIHPERNLVFFTKGYGNLVSYDMDRRIMHTICTPGPYRADAYKPYIPCFAEWLSDGH